MNNTYLYAHEINLLLVGEEADDTFKITMMYYGALEYCAWLTSGVESMLYAVASHRDGLGHAYNG